MTISKRILTSLQFFIALSISNLSLLDSTYAQTSDTSLASNGCLNVVIVNNFAYAACGQEIEIVSLTTLERRLINVAANDITADAEADLLFTQSGRNLTMLSLSNPLQPSVITTATTNFSVFSGVSATSGVLVVSGGAGSADTQIYSYTPNSLSLQTDGIPQIDSATGNPDVLLVRQTPTNLIAYYSQDIGGVANFAIQPVSINNLGDVISVSTDIVLTPGRFDFGLNLGPSNFPVESEILNNRLYVAHFAAQGLEVINTANNQLEQVIPLPFVPTNVASDGISLFVVGSNNDSVAVIDPNTPTPATILQTEQTLDRPTGIAASSTHIAVADRTIGLIIINRSPVSSPQPEISNILPSILLLLNEE